MKRDWHISLVFLTIMLTNCAKPLEQQVSSVLKTQIFKNAAWAMDQAPETVTADTCERSEGGIHDFYSEGDYWWQNPEDPTGKYIRRDGKTNPDNFVAHRLSMIRLSKVVGSLASAYLLTNDEKYVIHAFNHARAWFVNPQTLMNPNLLYAQAIKGIASGRGIGIIDTIHLMEVAQGINKMQEAACVDKSELETIKEWFEQYLNWLMTHPYGIAEMNAKNNHGTCWVMQVASFAKLTENGEILNMCRERYKSILLPNQMAENGSFPLEISRTKPYGYSLFNLDAMATICQILSTDSDNLWRYITPEGKSIHKGMEFMYQFIEDKSRWTLQPDIMYWDDFPIAQPSLIFAAINLGNNSYFDLWRQLEHYITVQEVERNTPVRNPVIWL